MKWIVITLLLASFVSAACIEPTDGMTITKDILFCSSTYDVPSGITVSASNIVVDCGTAVLRGTVGESEIGIKLENVDNVQLTNCNILTFNQGIYLKNVTNSVIEKNAVLKNRIGIRLLDSYENVIRDNNDKSFQLAVSAINSKYNIVVFGNKNVERGFCEVNACNEYRDMNACEAGDFYCSKKCTPETDADCGAPVSEPEELQPEPGKTVEELIEEAKQEVQQTPIASPEEVVKTKKLPIGTKLFIYVVLYIITFIVLRTLKKR